MGVMQHSLGQIFASVLFTMIACIVACEQQEVPQPPPPAEPPAALTGKLPPGQIPPGQIPPGQIPPGQIPPGQIPPGVAGQMLMSPQFGLTKQLAVNVCRPAGESSYLAALRCPDGSTPQFNRIGNVGARNPGSSGNNPAMLDANRVLPPGTVDEHIVDEYEVTCAGVAKIKVYFDMYHCRDPHPLRPIGHLRPVGGAGAVPPAGQGAKAPQKAAVPYQPQMW